MSANNVTRFLDSRKVPYTVYDLPKKKLGALETARLLEAPPEIPARSEVRLLGHHPLGGSYVASLSPALAEELEMPDNWAGVVITRVQRGTPADRLGFRPRDIILSLNGQSYQSSVDLAEALDRSSGKWQIVFKRDGKVRRVEFSS